MKVIREINNDLLKRREVVLENEYESNPGVSGVLKDIATHFKADENTIVVRKVGSSFGSGEFVIDAFVYDSAEQKEKIEPKKKEKKK
jgi:ribosomal protein S24E